MIVVRWLFLKEKIVLDDSTSVLQCIKIRSSSSHHFKQNSCPEAPLVVDDPFAIATWNKMGVIYLEGSLGDAAYRRSIHHSHFVTYTVLNGEEHRKPSRGITDLGVNRMRRQQAENQGSCWNLCGTSDGENSTLGTQDDAKPQQQQAQHCPMLRYHCSEQV